MDIPTLDGVNAKTVTTSRIATRVLFSGSNDGTPVVFVHGNASSATYWEEVMLALPDAYRGIAPDQRGYGSADIEKKIDATRGLGDLSDDLVALLDQLGLERAHFVGHSMGGAVIWQLMMDAPERIQSVTVVSPGSPFGFGGTKDEEGNMCFPDGAGSGGGIVNRGFIQKMAEGDRSSDDPQGSPRVVMNSFYWKPPFIPDREEELLSSLLSTHVGEEDYPGDLTASEHWPNVAPGKWGVANALSPLYAPDMDALYSIDPKPSVLWVRGADDQIVSDNSLFDLGTLGKMGAIPGYPGEDVFPSQPMVSQTRYMLQRYQSNGGQYQEVVIADAGHSAYIEKPDEFNSYFHEHLEAN